MSLVEELCDHVAIAGDGRVLASGSRVVPPRYAGTFADPARSWRGGWCRDSVL